MEITLLNPSEGNVIARGSYYGGPDYEFIVEADGQVYFQVFNQPGRVWAGPDEYSFRRIADAWTRYRTEVAKLSSEAEQLQRVAKMRRELETLGAFPPDLPPDPEPLWSLLVSEAEFGMN
jgi:hypothetical protein